MTREELWEKNYAAVWQFVQQNHRGPSRHHKEEFRLLNWMKYNRKILNQKQMEPGRKEKFQKLQELIHSFHRVNQYM